MLNYDLKNAPSLKEAITWLIVFFDLFEYPLSGNEVWQYLDKKYSLVEIISALESDSRIASKNGFYFLVGRADTIITRQKRYNYSVRKIKIAKRFSRFFILLPFIKVIALANSLGQHNLRDESDIDFFIITDPRRIWLTRLICAGIAKTLNRRPTPKNKKDKICLSFYITTENLNLDELKLPGSDPYFFFWLRTLVLLYNKEGVYEKFLIANGLNLSLVNSLASAEASKRKNHFLSFFEMFAKALQLKIMAPALKQAMNNSDGVVINNNILKFYLKDNRKLFAEKYGNKLRQIS